MKLIIAGSRDIQFTIQNLEETIKKNYDITKITEIVSGDAIGIDKLGIIFAEKYNIPVKKFIPDWSIGISAGHVRNRKMGDYADEAIVIYNGSSGSQGMIDYMNKLKKPCVIIKV